MLKTESEHQLNEPLLDSDRNNQESTAESPRNGFAGIKTPELKTNRRKAIFF